MIIKTLQVFGTILLISLCLVIFANMTSCWVRHGTCVTHFPLDIRDFTIDVSDDVPSHSLSLSGKMGMYTAPWVCQVELLLTEEEYNRLLESYNEQDVLP